MSENTGNMPTSAEKFVKRWKEVCESNEIKAIAKNDIKEAMKNAFSELLFSFSEVTYIHGCLKFRAGSTAKVVDEESYCVE